MQTYFAYVSRSPGTQAIEIPTGAAVHKIAWSPNYASAILVYDFDPTVETTDFFYLSLFPYSTDLDPSGTYFGEFEDDNNTRYVAQTVPAPG